MYVVCMLCVFMLYACVYVVCMYVVYMYVVCMYLCMCVHHDLQEAEPPRIDAGN